MQQLVEVALRALSPSTNEPFTATAAIDRLAQALGRVARRRMPSAIRVDEQGHVHVVSAPRTFDSLLATAFDCVEIEADSSRALCGNFSTRSSVWADWCTPNDRAAPVRLLDRVWASASRQIKDEGECRELAKRCDATRSGLESPAPPSQVDAWTVSPNGRAS